MKSRIFYFLVFISMFMVGMTKAQELPKTTQLKQLVQKKPSLQEYKGPYVSWALDPEQSSSINLKPAMEKFSKKKEIFVAVIDTGVDPSHPFIKDNLYLDRNRKATQAQFGIDFSKNHKAAMKPFDEHGHGTHIAGIIKSVVPTAKMLVLKYYNPRASGQENLKSTIAALKYAIDMNVDIINYSGGGPEASPQELKLLKVAEKKGILVVAAAGNDRSNIDDANNAYYPASYGLSNIITVGAHDQLLKKIPASNYGQASVDLMAPGYRIKSALPHGRAGYLTGTSQATAFVTGVAALLKSQYPEMKTPQLKAILKNSAKKEIRLVTACSSGGRLDAKTAFQLADTTFNKPATREVAQAAVPTSAYSKKGQIVYRFKN